MGRWKKHNPKVYKEFQTHNMLETLYILLGIIFNYNKYSNMSFSVFVFCFWLYIYTNMSCTDKCEWNESKTAFYEGGFDR